MPTRLVHAVALVPSHTFEVQILFGSDCGQAGRVGGIPVEPTGGPVIVVQVPTLPATLHASHWPPHEELQQTLSTQYLAPVESGGQSSATMHDVPSGVVMTVTVMFAVAVSPFASVAVTTSIPAFPPAVYTPPGDVIDAEEPEPSVVSAQVYGGVPPIAMNVCIPPAAMVSELGRSETVPVTVTVAVAVAPPESATCTTSITLAVFPAV
jgi:hypothetical protein